MNRLFLILDEDKSGLLSSEELHMGKRGKWKGGQHAHAGTRTHARAHALSEVVDPRWEHGPPAPHHISVLHIIQQGSAGKCQTKERSWYRMLLTSFATKSFVTRRSQRTCRHETLAHTIMNAPDQT